MCIPLRSMERTWPLGRMCAEPPPFSATCFPGGVCGPLAFAPLLGPLAVPAGPLAFGPPAPGVEPRWPPGAEPCCAPGAAECEGGDCLGGLACCCGAAGLGAASFEFGFCPQANIGTA